VRPPVTVASFSAVLAGSQFVSATLAPTLEPAVEIKRH
jgi:hypothetical protein